MRIVVLQTAFLGDCVLTLPFLARLSEVWPEARIDIVASPGGAALFEIALERGLAPMRARTRVHRYDKRGEQAGVGAAWRFARALMRDDAPIDIAFCLQRSLRTALLALVSGARERVGFSSGSAAFLYTHLVRRSWDAGQSEIEKNLDLLRAASPHAVAPWSPRTAPSLLRDPAGRTSDPTAPVAVLSLGSPWPTKRWPVENAAALASQLTQDGVEVHLVGDETTRPLSQSVRERVPSLLLKDLTGQTSLRDLIREIQGARVLVSGDSAAVHFASDLNVPTLALFGPTIPEFGFAPWRAGSEALGLDLPCRPCNIHGPKVCPLGHHRCLKDLGATQVAKSLRKFL